MKSQELNVQVIAEIGLALALSGVFSMLVLYKLPQGGVISLSMLPLFYMCFRRGLKIGLITALLGGALQMITDPFFVHPFQVILDYPLAWGAIGLAGIFKNRLALGVIVGTIGRFIFHFIAGVVYFGDYAPEGMSVAWYVVTYIGSHLLPTAVIIYFILLVFRKKDLINFSYN